MKRFVQWNGLIIYEVIYAKLPFEDVSRFGTISHLFLQHNFGKNLKRVNKKFAG